MNKKNTLLIFGFGYTAKFMCQKFSKKNWEVFCTTRFKEKAEEIKSLNATPVFFDDEEKIESILELNSYILSTAPPENGKDPVIQNYGDLFKLASKFSSRDGTKCIFYLYSCWRNGLLMGGCAWCSVLSRCFIFHNERNKIEKVDA